MMKVAASVTAALAAISATGVASQPLVNDDPFIEYWSDRRVTTSSGWTPDTLPSNFTMLPCIGTGQAFTAWVLTQADPSVYTPTSFVDCTTSGLGVYAVAQRTLIQRPAGDKTFTTLAGSQIGPWTSQIGDFTVYGITFDGTTQAQVCNLYSQTCRTVAVLRSGTSGGFVPVATVHVLNSSTERLWVSYASASNSTTFACDVSTGSSRVAFSSSVASSAIAYSATLNEIAMGNDSRIAFWDATTLQLRNWEWVTDIAQGWGAPVDDVITALAYDDNDGTLYIGNPTCLNIRFPNGTFARVAGLQGLPYNNITSLAIDPRSDSPNPRRVHQRVWIGTLGGLILFDPDAQSQYGVATPGSISVAPRWKFFLGPRWLPVESSNVLDGAIYSVACNGNDTIVNTFSGIAVVTATWWTLADKARWMASQIQPFDLYGQGLVGDCGLAGFGRYPCTYGPNDNNGLWTSLMVAAETLRFGTTGDPDAASAALHWFSGMKLLNDVTGIKGLFARSALPPGAPCPAGSPWYNSTSMPGYCFKATASSDEMVGHMMAYPLMADLVAPSINTSLQAEVIEVFLNIARYIVKNNFTLVDVTGQPTQWGHWEPAYLNQDRSWSDTRGLNSIQILALINTALRYTEQNSADWMLFTNAFSYLAETNGYLRNMLNTRINAPCDINYSDDELTFFSYFALFWSASTNNTELFQWGTASLQRSWSTAVSALRSNLWGGIYLASLAGPNMKNAYAGNAATPPVMNIVADIIWNLRTWSHDLISWPVHNSQRLDVFINPETDRFGNSGGESLSVLAQDERNQDRWNADPYDLNGGGGTSMSDPGVWLFPYWLARYLGVLA